RFITGGRFTGRAPVLISLGIAMENLEASTRAVAGTPARKIVLDAAGRPYEPAVGPRLKILLLAFIFPCVALLGATGVYLLAIRALEWYRGLTYTNQFTLWMFIAHVFIGVLLLAPFLAFGFIHLLSARHRKNRLAV